MAKVTIELTDGEAITLIAELMRSNIQAEKALRLNVDDSEAVRVIGHSMSIRQRIAAKVEAGLGYPPDGYTAYVDGREVPVR